jgi:hypothetical protein
MSLEAVISDARPGTSSRSAREVPATHGFLWHPSGMRGVRGPETGGLRFAPTSGYDLSSLRDVVGGTTRVGTGGVRAVWMSFRKDWRGMRDVGVVSQGRRKGVARVSQQLCNSCARVSEKVGEEGLGGGSAEKKVSRSESGGDIRRKAGDLFAKCPRSASHPRVPLASLRDAWREGTGNRRSALCSDLRL